MVSLSSHNCQYLLNCRPFLPMTGNVLLPTIFVMDAKAIGSRIQMQRVKAGFTQASLAEKMRVSRESVSQWESGETTPRRARMEKLAELLQTTAHYLLFGDAGKHLTAKEQKLLEDWNTLPSELKQDYAKRINIIATALKQTLPNEVSFDTIPPRRRHSDPH